MTNFLNFGSYGFFVLLAFGLVLFVCAGYYLKVLKDLKETEQAYAKNVAALSLEQKQAIAEKSRIADKILSSSSKTI